ncbi:CubicO group peptidase (beta-lactamase class C family) [Krasilnikovia cinnamomea]|uniref:CubicO group peptidase (Beta-lactamase class C family) n=1 Tax=Krasilnikovia cinnamomea TaxID=349313 RepID=A0A4Q7ZRH1_9ACTN|nr:serine hydrolase [Krasilnikovia cinnamomea]RZU53742.1 CubicO group peptidase (beta-lactamase class C family) [Krasilnikovia cinnamomea]
MVDRRTVLGAAGSAVIATAAGLAAPARQAAAHTGAKPGVTPADIRFRPRVLRTGTAQEVGLIPEYVDRVRTGAEAYLSPTTDHPAHPAYAGAVVLAARDGVVVQRAALGTAVRYRAVGPPPERAGVELPPAEQRPTRPDTIFDLASVSKLFTAITVLQQAEHGRVDLNAPVARYVPEFGKVDVTVRMLLTHTSGLPASAPLWSAYPDPPSRLAAALACPLLPGTVPGGQYLYSDLGFIALGALVEQVSRLRLDRAVHAGITGPLGMADTGYHPRNRERVAATEYQPYAGRGMVWGEVHDENAWSLGGGAGHAGVFSTADDLAVLCQALLGGGRYGGARILRASTVRAMLTARVHTPDGDRGLGFELNAPWYMDALSSPVTFGHTGFTGTSVVVDPLSHSFVILLTNRVHPDRNWGGNNEARRAVARAFADASPVRPQRGGAAWRAARRDAATVTLTAPLRAPAAGPAAAAFLLWYDTEPGYDRVRVESSADGGATWRPVALRLRSATGGWESDGVLDGYGGRHWSAVSATLPPGTTHLRWAYTTDATAQGRGVYVDGVLVLDRTGALFHGEAGDARRFEADGWAPSEM